MLVVIGDLIADIVVIGVGELAHGTDNPVTITQTRGGSAANVASAAAPLGPVRFIGSIGSDAAGAALANELAAADIDVRVQRHGHTGSIVVLVADDGERTMLTDRGAAAELSEIDQTWLEGATWVHVPLYGCTDEPSRAAVMASCTAAPAPVSLDLSSVATMTALGAVSLQRIVDELSPAVVFANRDEFALAQTLGLTFAEDCVVVVKRGAEPVLVRIRGMETSFDVPPADVVDTTGAGDAFAAGFLQSHRLGADVATSVVAGIELAQRAVSSPGAL